MRLLPEFSPKKSETVIGFGLTWSLVGSALALTYLASCSYIIPENPRPPRYNTVMGEKRIPPKNPSPANNFTMPETRQQNMMPAPRPQSQITPQPPRPQEQPFVQSSPPLAQRSETATMAPSQDYSWWNPRGWFDGAQPAQPSNTPTNVRNSQPPATYNDQIVSQSVPAPMMQPLPGPDAYPTLQDTPQSPLFTGQAQARDKLNYARGDMEAELDAANARSGQLQRDANTGQSLLSTMPEYQSPPTSVTRPSAITSNDLGPPKSVTPTGSAYSNEVYASEPISLQPPAGEGQPVETAGMSTSMSTMDNSTSDFDPMSGSTQPIQLRPPEGTYSGTRYLPDSRYNSRRAY